MQTQTWTHFVTLATAILLASATASAQGGTVIEGIDFQRHEDAVLVHYHTSGGYDPANLRVGRSGKVLRVVFSNTRVAGKKKSWPKPHDKFVKGSFAYQVSPTMVRHKLRLATAVDLDDITVRRFGDVVVVRVPKNAAGGAVGMAPADAPDAKEAPEAQRASATPSPRAEAAGHTPTGAGEERPADVSPDSDPLDVAAASDLVEPDPKAAAGREALLRDLLGDPAPEAAARPAAASETPVTFLDDHTSTDTAAAAGELPGLGADLPSVDPIKWVLVLGFLGLVLVIARRKARQPGSARAADGRSVTVLDRKTVVGKNGVALIEAAGRLVLVGTSETGLTALADLGPSDEDFDAVVARASGPASAPRTAPPAPPVAQDDSAAGPQAVAEVLAAALNDKTPTRTHLAADRASHAVKVPVAAADAVDAFRAKVKALRSA